MCFFATHLSARRISGVTNTSSGLPNTARHEEAASKKRNVRYNLRSSARRLSHYMPGVTRYSVTDGIGLYLAATTAEPTSSGAIHRDLLEVLRLWLQDGRCVVDKSGRLPVTYTMRLATMITASIPLGSLRTRIMRWARS